MLIMLATSLYLSFSGHAGGLWVDEVRSHIESAIVADEQRGRALEVVDDIDESLGTVNKQLQESVKALNKIHRRHDATVEDYRAVFVTLDSARNRAAESVTSARDQLRVILNRDQWHAAFSEDGR